MLQHVLVAGLSAVVDGPGCSDEFRSLQLLQLVGLYDLIWQYMNLHVGVRDDVLHPFLVFVLGAGLEMLPKNRFTERNRPPDLQCFLFFCGWQSDTLLSLMWSGGVGRAALARSMQPLR